MLKKRLLCITSLHLIFVPSQGSERSRSGSSLRSEEDLSQHHHTYQNLPQTLSPPPDPLYQISNHRTYQEVGVPQLYNSLRRKCHTTAGLVPSANISNGPLLLDAIGPGQRPAEERLGTVLVPNLKPKPFHTVHQASEFNYFEVSSTDHKVVFNSFHDKAYQTLRLM